MREMHEGGFGEHERLSLQDQGEQIKNTLQRVTPIPSGYDSALRDMMIDAVLNGEDIRRFFLSETLSDTTGVFLQRVIAAEMDIAQTIIDQHALIKEDRPTFLASLCSELTEEEQSVCQAGFAQLPHGRASVERLMRYLNGEPLSHIGADHGIGRIGAWQSCNRLKHAIQEGDERMADILERLTPRFPQHLRSSIAEGLPECLAYIDDELSTLKARREQKLDEEAFSYLAWSFVNSSVTAEEALLILARLNAPRLLSLSKINPLHKMNGGYRKKAMLKYNAHSAFFQTFQKTTQNIYENSDEATDLLLQAMAAREAGKIPPFSKTKIIAYAKDIEAGVLAADLLRQDEKDWRLEATKEELHQLIELGRMAVHQLLKSHVDFVNFQARKMIYRMDSPRETEDLTLVGMRGLLRAIRKYDHTTNYTLTTLASDIIDQFLQRDIMRHDWIVPDHIGRQLVSLRAHRSILMNELREEPSPQAIAERMGVSLAKINALLVVEVRLRHQIKGEYDVEPNQPKDPMESTNSFGTNTKLLLQQALKNQPFGYEILEMRFAQKYLISEVAEVLKTSQSDIRQRLEAALTTLKSSIEPATLSRILNHD